MNKTLFVLIAFLCISQFVKAQSDVVDNIQILQQPIFDAADTNLSLEYGEGWLEGFDIKYDCLVNKVDSTDILSATLFVISNSDTVFANSYTSLSDSESQLIINNSYSAIIPIDTLLYSDDYQFMLHVYNENGILLQLISAE